MYVFNCYNSLVHLQDIVTVLVASREQRAVARWHGCFL